MSINSRWRVTEISQILLVLLDSRCPLLHFPHSLATYLQGREVILVLTKVDISGAARAEAWTDYFRKRYPHLRVVQVESYVGKASDNLQGCKIFEPHLPISFKERLVEEIKAVHAELLQPPDKVKANPKWLQQWKPSVKRDIDWVGALNTGGSNPGAAVGEPVYLRNTDEAEDSASNEEPEFLTIGLIGKVFADIPNLTTKIIQDNLMSESRHC
jgi:hypothetical protein